MFPVVRRSCERETGETEGQRKGGKREFMRNTTPELKNGVEALPEFFYSLDSWKLSPTKGVIGRISQSNFLYQRVSADMTFRNPESESDFHFPSPELVNHSKDVKRKEIPVISWYRIKTVRVVD